MLNLIAIQDRSKRQDGGGCYDGDGGVHATVDEAQLAIARSLHVF
jgi:hypothetical protein